jgi:hypothetical protein
MAGEWAMGLERRPRGASEANFFFRIEREEMMRIETGWDFPEATTTPTHVMACHHFAGRFGSEQQQGYPISGSSAGTDPGAM